jgi:hypothetical protein
MKPERRAESGPEHDVLRALRGIRYGSVEVIVHDSKIVQIVRKEKLRPDGHGADAGTSPR